MNDDELKRQLDDLVPEPGAGYWERIDAMLSSVEAEGAGSVGAERAGSVGAERAGSVGAERAGSVGAERAGTPTAEGSQDPWDTDDNVIRLTDMNEKSGNGFGPAAGNRLMLMAAAILLVVVAVGALFVATRGSDTTDLATNGQDDVDTTPSSLDTDVEVGAVATFCFFDDDSELFQGEAGTRMVLYESGAVTAVDRFVAADGTDFQSAYTGYVIDREKGFYSMSGPVGADQSWTRVWIADDSGLTTAEDSYLPAIDCAEVEEFLSVVPTPAAVAPGTKDVEPVLAAGRYCFVGDQPLSNAYEIVVGDDGRVASRWVDYQGPDLLIVAFATGTGRFASPTDIVVETEIWTPPQLVTSTDVYTIVGDALQPTIYPDLLAVPTDCELLDRLSSRDHGFTIVGDEDLSFAAGASSAIVEGGFVRGEADLYRVEASKGQTLTATISSLEDNAAVGLYGPGGLLLLKNEEGLGSSSVVLPSDGVYEVMVSGIRGNVSYTLTVEID